MFAFADESAHPTSALEWWFVQGYYESRRAGRRHFMTAFFRHAVGQGPGREADGFSFLLSVTNPETGRQEAASKVDGGLLDWVAGRGREQFGSLNLDAGLVSAFLDEVAAQGPLRPVVQDRSPAVLKSAPLRVAWGDFRLAQVGPACLLHFTEPGDAGRACRLRLSPLGPRREVDVRDETGAAPGHMAYFTYPRIRLSGQAGGEEVAGEAWLDHQWGDLGWLRSRPSGGRVLGWDWFGLNLEDGSDWVIAVHRDAQTGEPVGRHVTVWDGRARHFSCALVLTPLRFWQAPRTRIRHPVAWRIEAPELAADLTFEPLSDTGEVPLFGPGRAIWEGPGTVVGTVVGRTVRGRAWGEFQGHGHLFDFQSYLDDFAADIDAGIEAFLPREIDEDRLRQYVGAPHWAHEPEASTAVLARPVWDLIGRKGKRWRPAFGMLFLEALGVSAEPYRDLLCVLPELIHTGSLVVDDIQDDSQIRRGDDCLHRRYGLDVALSAGNTLYFLPLLLLADHPHLSERQRLHIHEVLQAVFRRAHFGQGVDIYWSSHLTRANLDRWLEGSLGEKVLQMYACKTAAFCEGFAEVAAIIAAAGEGVRRAGCDFARGFGVAFQVLDDVRNFSTSPHWTKVCGEDLGAGKLTYVIVRALGLLGGAGRERLAEVLCSPALRAAPAALAEGVELVRRSGALRACQEEARRMAEREWDRLSPHLGPSEPKVLLRLLCSRMLELPYDP
jgi:geranylgeranyl pyrophosphate synthase/predicted secreted hydrolase